VALDAVGGVLGELGVLGQGEPLLDDRAVERFAGRAGSRIRLRPGHAEQPFFFELELGWSAERPRELAAIRRRATQGGYLSVIVRWKQHLGRDGLAYGLCPHGDFPHWRGSLAAISEFLDAKEARR